MKSKFTAQQLFDLLRPTFMPNIDVLVRTGAARFNNRDAKTLSALLRIDTIAKPGIRSGTGVKTQQAFRAGPVLIQGLRESKVIAALRRHSKISAVCSGTEGRVYVSTNTNAKVYTCSIYLDTHRCVLTISLYHPKTDMSGAARTAAHILHDLVFGVVSI